LSTIPDILKQATTPLLKKPSLDDRDYNHFQPISTLSLITKALEKTVLNQLHFLAQIKFLKLSSLV